MQKRNEAGRPPLEQCSVGCWVCRYCDKESVLKGDKWVLTRTGHCLAEKSAVNGENDFYKKVYVNTIYESCSQFKPFSQRPTDILSAKSKTKQDYERRT